MFSLRCRPASPLIQSGDVQDPFTGKKNSKPQTLKPKLQLKSGSERRLCYTFTKVKRKPVRKLHCKNDASFYTMEACKRMRSKPHKEKGSVSKCIRLGCLIKGHMSKAGVRKEMNWYVRKKHPSMLHIKVEEWVERDNRTLCALLWFLSLQVATLGLAMKAAVLPSCLCKSNILKEAKSYRPMPL